MLQPPTGDKRVPTIGDPHGGRPKTLATRKELRLLVFGLVGLLGIAMWFFRGVPPPREELITSPTEAVVVPMARPALDRLADLPDAAAVANARTDIEAMVRAGEVPSVKFGLDAAAMAWAERLLAEDAQRRRIPQRITTEELVTDQIRPGQLVVLNGRLDSVRVVTMPGREETSYRWLSLAIEDGQYAVAFQRIDPEGVALTLNARVQVLGRYLGRVPMPTDADDVMVPTIATSIVTPISTDMDNGRAGLAGYQGAVPLVDDLYRDVDDERPLVESHPYYLTLGRVKSEMGTPELVGPRLDANRLANAIHQDPAAYRGKPVEVRGAVWHAWEDAMVATDRPFDVRRVVRVLMYRRDIGPITENGKTVTKSVLRIFELAAITDQPLPQPGDFIIASGRFMKWRAIPSARHPGMENLLGSTRQSGNVYTMFIVAGPWRIEEPVEVDWTPLVVLLSAAGVAFAGMVLWFVNRDRGAEQRLKASVATLRRRRRELQSRPAAPADDSAPGPTEPAPTDTPDR